MTNYKRKHNKIDKTGSRNKTNEIRTNTTTHNKEQDHTTTYLARTKDSAPTAHTKNNINTKKGNTFSRNKTKTKDTANNQNTFNVVLVVYIVVLYSLSPNVFFALSSWLVR